jgi:hypothetical protein
MRISVSLPAADVAFLGSFARSSGSGSRSASVRRAIRVLRHSELGPAYEEAWSEWAQSESVVWKPTAGDGLDA